MVEVEWDDEKAARNFRVHKLGFVRAALVFDDKNRMEFLDQRENYGEEDGMSSALPASAL